MNTRPLVSLLIPIYNGEELVEDLYAELAPVLDQIEGGAEGVVVDDGSQDGTLEALGAIQRRDSRVRVVELATNFGQHAALAAGFEHSKGTYLVTMDADLQCDPRDVPRLLAPLKQGYDLVSGVRLERRDPPVRRMLSLIVSRMVTALAGIQLRDVGCPFNACTADVARSVSAFGELRRFLKPLAVRLARRVTEVEVVHRPRHRHSQGSSYSSTGLVRLFMDFFVNALGDVFAWVFMVGSVLAGVLLLAALAMSVNASMRNASETPALVALSLGIMATLVALLGLAGDYVQRIHRQSSGRPFYLVRNVHEASRDRSADEPLRAVGRTEELVAVNAASSSPGRVSVGGVGGS